MVNVTEISTRLTAQRAVILTRVSSKEQEDGYSIEAQKHRLRVYCNRKSLKILKTFEITESSTTGDRRKFMAMIKFIKSQRATIALVADKVDRVQRSFKEYPLLDELINSGKIELHFNTENYVIHKDSVSQERLMWSMGVIMAQSYIDNMRDNVKRSIDQKIRQGEWIATAPIGYLNARDNKGKSTVIVDSGRALLIRRLFQEYSTGAYTISEITRKTKEWGLVNKAGKKSYLSRSQVHKTLRNPFYYGNMLIKGKTYPHQYEPIIDKALFDKCQNVLDSWKKKPFQYRSKEFLFRGLITCATSGRTVTSDTKKKTYSDGSTAQWTYLRCRHPENPEKHKWVREEKIITQIEEVIKNLQIPDSILENVSNYLRQTDHTERAFRRRQIKELQSELSKIENRLDVLLDLLLDGAIDKEEYHVKKSVLHDKQTHLDNQIRGHRAGDEGFKDGLLTLISLSSEAYELFKSSQIAQKRMLLKFLFANLEMEGEKLHYTLNKPFDHFIKVKTCQEWRALVDALRTHQNSHEFIIDQITEYNSLSQLSS